MAAAAAAAKKPKGFDAAYEGEGEERCLDGRPLAKQSNASAMATKVLASKARRAPRAARRAAPPPAVGCARPRGGARLAQLWLAARVSRGSCRCSCTRSSRWA